ncbi:adenylate/guanylate cyclase domain-containing protein [Microvirga yunnanensis]|uniref:adenylate/guanylate cyclase domain-containing protein n=1 Tax=Microvirga yunnanensis TaxID=2953740 RepID=UPI0021C60602|nr:adenylate/guanylate cyclase domain-containing protein [Microvirga sp. HBU65207]
MDVAQWLRSLGLAQYEQAFRDNAVDADILPRLTGDDLKELGVHAVGHRRKLLDAISHLDRSLANPANSGVEAERRQLTVMFCDLVESTALASKLDPEDYRAVLSAYHAACSGTVAECGGFVAKYMGDGVLAYFGYPQAHEDDAIRAVRAGLALAEEVARVSVPSGVDPLCARVGIATGVVVVGDLIGAGPSQERSVVGETPNLAARLQTFAAPGAVVIAPATRRLLGSEFNLTDLGPQHLKGFAAPIEAWQVLGTRAVESRFEAHGAGTTPLIGRTEELRVLALRWEQARGGNGQVALVTGEAGIGKSRVVREFRDHLRSEPHTDVQCQCSPFFSSSPLYPFIKRIERDAGFRQDDPAGERLVKLEILLAQATHEVLTIAPVFAAMLSLPMPDRYGPSPYDLGQQRELTMEALIGYLLGLSRQRPLLLLVEDAHWSDPTTLEVMDRLVDRVASERVMLLITSRPEFSPRWRTRSDVMVLPLAGLSQHQTAELAEAIAGGAELPADTFQQIVERTDGVPLFVEELTKAVLEREAGAVPATLHDSLMARLDRVPAAKAVAQQASVIGREFTYDVLAGINPQDGAGLGAALGQLISAGLVSMRGTPPDATYTFKHALVRDAAYGSLLKSRRQELHGRVADVLERFPDVVTRQPELIAHHLSEARLAGRAVPYWQRAADDAARRQAHQEAIAHCIRGLDMVSLIPDPGLRDQHELRLQVRLGNSATSAKGYSAPEVGTALYRARDLCRELGDEQLVHPILVGLFFFHVNKAELRTAEKLGIELLALGDARNDRILQIDGHKTLLNARYKLGKFVEAQEHFERGMRLYEKDPWPAALIEQFDDPGPHLLVIGGCVLWVRGYPDQARQAVAEAVALGYRGGHHLSTAHAVHLSGHLAELMDDWASVRKANEATMAVATEWGLAGLRHQVALRERLVAVALHDDPEQMEYKRRHPQPGFARPLHDGVLARAYGRRGAPEEGLQVIGESLVWAEDTGSQFFDAELHRIRAGLLLHIRCADEAEWSYRKALEIARGQGAWMWALRAACDLAQMLRERRCQAEAHDILAPIYGWFTEGFDVDDLQRAKALMEGLSCHAPSIR